MNNEYDDELFFKEYAKMSAARMDYLQPANGISLKP